MGIREPAPGQSCPHYLLCRPRSRLDITFSDCLLRILINIWEFSIEAGPKRYIGCTSSLTIGAWRPSTQGLPRPHGAHSSWPFETGHDLCNYITENDERFYEDRNPRSTWGTASP